jgi:hypothetical protein
VTRILIQFQHKKNETSRYWQKKKENREEGKREERCGRASCRMADETVFSLAFAGG